MADNSNVLTKEFLQNLKGGMPVNGFCLVRNYSIQLTKTGKEYAVGFLQSGVQIGFKAWNNSNAFPKLKAEEYTNQVCMITGMAQEYQGVVDIVIDNIQAVAWEDTSVFLEEKYPMEAYWDALKNTFSSSVSAKALSIANSALFENTLVADRFKLEFAAQSHHDNCKSGLLAHTYKVLVSVVNFLTTYPTLVKSADEKDLVLLGALLHDIGKTREMELGVYQKCSVATHRYLGIEMLPKDMIIDAYGEQGWYTLVSVLLQHHGEFDDKCRSLAAYLVFQADLLDARLTDLVQSMDKPIMRDGMSFLKSDGYMLQLNE